MLPPVLTYVQPAAEPPADDRSAARRGAGCLLEIVETVVLTLVIYLVIHNFVAQPFEVEQNSMVSTILPGDYVLIDKLTPRWNDYDRGDIVVFQPPDGFEQGGVPFIKRVIGLPGDTIDCDGKVVRNGQKLTEPYVPAGVTTTGCERTEVKPGELYVMGDNRTNSQDSRAFGVIRESDVVGRAFVRIWPLTHTGWLRRDR
jgi:signal peptidase I